jgi:hypothetical protein
VITNSNLYHILTRTLLATVFLMQFNAGFAQLDDRGVESGGTIAEDETICYGDLPEGIRNTASPSGDIEGLLIFKWEKRTEMGSWEVILGATLLEYYPGPISETTYFRRGCREEIHQPWTYSNTVVKNVVPHIEDVSVSVTDIICKGEKTGTAVANVTGGTPGFLFEWSNGDTGPLAEDLIAGTYSVTARDNNNCEFIKHDIVVREPEVSVEIVESFSIHPTCPGFEDGFAFINVENGEPPYTFEWSNGMTEPNLFGVGAGRYDVIVTDALGCTFELNDLEVIEPAAFELSTTSAPVTCNGMTDGSAEISGIGGTPPYEFYWEDGSTSPSRSSLSGGTHDVIIVDMNGCLFLDSVIITEPTVIAMDPFLINNKLCNASVNILPSGGTAPYDFEWEDGSSMSYRTGLCPGEYTVTMSDSFGCEQEETITILSVPKNETIKIEIVSNPYVETEGIRITVPTNDLVSINIYNTAGQLIESIEEMPSEADFQIWLETGRYANGLYVLDVQAGNLHASQKVAFF